MRRPTLGSAMRVCAVVVVFTLGSACGSSGSDAGSGFKPTSCQTATDCPLWECKCGDGTWGFWGSGCDGSKQLCLDPQTMCKGSCSNHGGIKSVQEYPETTANILASKECQAYCTKYDSVFGSCPPGGNFQPKCDPELACMPHQGECPAALQARLTCEVDTGTWSCSGIGDNCSSNPTACPGG